MAGIKEQRALLQERLSWMLKVKPLLPFVDEDLLQILEGCDTSAAAPTERERSSLHATKEFDGAGVTEMLHVLLYEGQHGGLLEMALEAQSRAWARKFEAVSRFDNFVVALNIGGFKYSK
jgi:hypothetical protein